MPGSGASRRAGCIEERDCGQTAPSRKPRAGRDVEHLVQHQRLGQLGHVVRRHAQVEGACTQRVHAHRQLRRQVLRLGAGLRAHPHPAAPSTPPAPSRDRTAAGAGEQRGHPGRPRLGDASQHRVGEAGHAASGHGPRQLDALADGRAIRHRIREQQFADAHPQRVSQLGLQPHRPPPGQRLQRVIDACAAAAPSRMPAASPGGEYAGRDRRGQRREGAVGVGILLERAAHHLVGDTAGVRHAGHAPGRRRGQAAQVVRRRHPPLAGRLQLQNPQPTLPAAHDQIGSDIAGAGGPSSSTSRPPDQAGPVADARPRADVRRQRPHPAVELDRRARPVEHPVGRGDLFGVGDALGRLRLRRRLLQQRPLEQRHAQLQRPARTTPASSCGPIANRCCGQDRPGVELGGDRDHRHRRLGVAGHDRPLDRRRAAPARQRRGMQVDQRIGRQQRLADDLAEGDHDAGISLRRLEAGILRLGQGKAQLAAAAATGGGASFRPRPLGRSGWRHHRHHVHATALNKRAQHVGAERRRAEEGDVHPPSAARRRSSRSASRRSCPRARSTIRTPSRWSISCWITRASNPSASARPARPTRPRPPRDAHVALPPAPAARRPAATGSPRCRPRSRPTARPAPG